MPPPAELRSRPQDGISWVQKVAAVELGFLAPYLIVWGYVGIYRRKEYVGGASRGPRGRGRAQGGGALHPRDCLVAFLTEGPSLLDLI